MDELERSVRAVVRDCLGVKQGEEAVVVCNPATERLGERLREEAAAAGADAVLAVISERASHAAEPPRTVAEAMAACDVLLAPTVQSLSHTAARKRATEAGARAATLPGVT
jgi:leucyl aminopeptidase (aminopeptidase T)